MEKAGLGEAIHYAIADSPLDRMLIASTASGICAVAFGDRDEDLVRELRTRYPQAEISRAEDGLPRAMEHLLRHLHPQIAPEPGGPALAVDVAGTPFQHSVWAAMQAIPRGETMEYGELAAQLGLPKAQRAVGAAIGRNPLAVLIPCHRLVARGGGLHAFRWGLGRKERLLAMERRQTGLAEVAPTPKQGELRFGEPEPDATRLE